MLSPVPSDGPRQGPVRLSEALADSWRYTADVSNILTRHRADFQHLVDLTVPAIRQATVYEDTRLATDYQYCPPSTDVPVAVRVRSNEHLIPYGREFVLRNSAPPGVRTEAQKITEDPDSARLYLYGFEDPFRAHIEAYVLVDCVRLREVFSQLDDPTRLGARVVRFDRDSLGLSIPVAALLKEGCVIGARFARPMVPSQSQVRALLAMRPEADCLLPHQRSHIELMLMRLLKVHVEYRIGDIL